MPAVSNVPVALPDDLRLPNVTPAIATGHRLLHRCHVRRRLKGRSALSTTYSRLKQHADLLTQSLPPSGPRHPDDVFEPTSAQPRESIAPSAMSGQDRSTPTSAQPRETFAPSARSDRYRSPIVCDESEDDTDSLTSSARESIAPYAQSAQYRSPTVSGRSEDGTDTSTASARSSQSRAPTASDESIESSNVSDTSRASENHPMLPLDPVQVVGDLDVPCLTDADKKLLKTFKKSLAENKLTECPQCLISWFTIKLNSRTGVCQECTKDNAFRVRNPQLPALWSEANALDPGEPPEHLEALETLTPLEEWLIARVHTRMQVMTYHGAQYKYRGHIISFHKNVPTMHHRLPVPPGQLDILILRPRNQTDQPNIINQFRTQLRVRRPVLAAWLRHLQANHSGYSDVTIDEDALSQLPDDGDVNADLQTEDVDPADLEDLITEIENDDLEYDVSVIPNLGADETEIDRLRGLLRRGQGGPNQSSDNADAAGSQGLQMPAVRSTPISDTRVKTKILSLAYPSLYPWGKGDFATSRQRTVEFKAYMQHMLRLSHGRFARHPMWRYAFFNMLMRTQAARKSTFFFKKDNSMPLMVQEFRDTINSNGPESRALINRIICFSSTITGTRAYWTAKRQQLDAMVRTLGCPALFLTFSAADLHWEDLAKLMPRYDGWCSASDAGKACIARENLKNSSHIAASYFGRRFACFLKEVLKPKFGITDHWYRFEWQARGSPHIHGLFWMKDAPTIDPELHDEAKLANFHVFKTFWGPHVTAINPHPGQPALDTNPLTYLNTLPTFRDVGAIANRVQRHACSQYCQRRVADAQGNLTSIFQCRFHFPRPTHTRPELVESWNRHYKVFEGARDDERLNHYNRTITCGWQANTDVSPCTCIGAVVNYMVKYVGKAEKHTLPYGQLVEEAINKCRELNESGISAVLRAMNSDVASQHGVDPGASLNSPQRRVYRHIVSHIESVIAHQAPARFPDPILMQVDGQGGTGKSFLISTLVAKLETLRLGCVALAAPTGIAALNIGGSTIHSLLRLRGPLDFPFYKSLDSVQPPRCGGATYIADDWAKSEAQTITHVRLGRGRGTAWRLSD